MRYVRLIWLPVLPLLLGSLSEHDKARQRLETLRQQDEKRLAFLRQELEAFKALPPERQKDIRQLHQDLHSLDEKLQKRYWGVLERYTVWLENLRKTHPDRYRQIEETTDPQERLKLIKTLRIQHEMAYLVPEAREMLRRTPEKDWPAIWPRVRRKHREVLQATLRPKPVKPSDKPE